MFIQRLLLIQNVCIKKKKTVDRKCSQRFWGNNKGERRYKISLCKICFLLGKINSVIVSLVLLGLFTDQNDSFSYPFIYYSYWNFYFFKYLKPKKGTPFARSLPIKANMWSTPSSLCTTTRLPLHEKNWMSSFSSGRLAVYKIKPFKNTPDNKLKNS